MGDSAFFAKHEKQVFRTMFAHMIQPTNKTTPSLSQVFSLAPYRELKTYQIRKVALVAIGCLMLFGLQFSCSLALSAGIALACSTITLLSETFLRKSDRHNIDWMNE